MQPSKRTHVTLIPEAGWEAALSMAEPYLQRLAGASSVALGQKGMQSAEKTVSAVCAAGEIRIPLGDLVDFAKEVARLEKEKQNLAGEIARSEGKLNNQGFIAKAPAALVEQEKGKLALNQQKAEQVEKRIAELKESIATALAEAITGMTTDLREALKPAAAEVIEPVAEAAPVVEPAAEIDHVALATEVAKAELPAEVIPGVVTAVKEGKTIADAVAGQVALREAFKAHAPAVTTVRITESAREPEGSTRDQVLAAFKN